MPRREHQPPALEPIERASLDELQGLQRQRLAWSIRHAYDNVSQFRARCDAEGVHPDDFRTLDDLARFRSGIERSQGKARRVIDRRK